MICRTLTDANFVIADPLIDEIPDDAAELLAAAVLGMIEAEEAGAPERKGADE